MPKDPPYSHTDHGKPWRSVLPDHAELAEIDVLRLDPVVPRPRRRDLERPVHDLVELLLRVHRRDLLIEIGDHAVAARP
jgi:hypothetical protein